MFIQGEKALQLFEEGLNAYLQVTPQAYLHDASIHAFNLYSRLPLRMSESNNFHSFKYLSIVATIAMLNKSSTFYEDLTSDVIKTANSISSPYSKVNAVTLCKDIMMSLTINVFFKDCKDTSALKENITSWINMHNSFIPIALQPFIYSNWDKGICATRKLDEIIKNEIERRTSQYFSETKSTQNEDFVRSFFGNDLIGTMLHTANKRAENYIKFQQYIQMFVMSEYTSFIHDLNITMASLCIWTLVEMEKSLIIKDTLVTEIRNYKHALGFDVLSDPLKLPYLHSVVEESLRRYSFLSSPYLRRTAVFDIMYEGVTIPGGTVIFFPISSISTSASVHKNPLTYDPNRHVPSQKSSCRSSHNESNAAASLSCSFGVGEHRCPAADGFVKPIMKSIIFVLVKYFDFHADTTLQFGEVLYPRNALGDYIPIPKDELIFSLFENRNYV